MSASKLLLIAALTIATALTSGCDPFALFEVKKPVYVPPGAMAELAEPVSATCWITNAQTKEREQRVVKGQPGWKLVRPLEEEFGVPAVQAEKETSDEGQASGN